MGIKKLILECDSKVVIDIINNPRNLKNHPTILFRNIFNWKNKNWNLFFVNIYRKDNRCTDCLVRCA
ncbi:hypothetical protein AHAS_Ahas12G0179100 [Arachis hypogaea]